MLQVHLDSTNENKRAKNIILVMGVGKGQSEIRASSKHERQRLWEEERERGRKRGKERKREKKMDGYSVIAVRNELVIEKAWANSYSTRTGVVGQ